MMGLAILSDKSFATRCIPCVVYEKGPHIMPLKNKLLLFLQLEYMLLNCVFNDKPCHPAKCINHALVLSRSQVKDTQVPIPGEPL